MFEYEYLNGEMGRKRKEYNKGILIFDGEYLSGYKWNGKGKIYNKNILVFEGEYLNGKFWNGKGKEYENI